jgi:uncharacterized protein DUF6599
MKFPRLLTALFLLWCALPARLFAAPRAAQILPQDFAGWQIAKPAETSKDPSVADSVNAGLLKEFGFTDFERAVYARDDGRKLTIKAARFQDATGAYGALAFYRTAEMETQDIGDRGYSLNNRVLFYHGNILIDAVFQQLSEMSAAELRELSTDLPRPAGGEVNLPELPAYLPKQGAVKNTERYVEGPIGLGDSNVPVPAQYVDFSKRAEVALQNYSLAGSTETLMLIGYPTPQIAAAQLEQMQQAQASHQLDEQIRFRRTGPLLAIVSGPASDSAARSLLAAVNYDANVTWNERTPNKRDNVAALIVGIIILAAIIGGISIITGLAYGGFRLAVKRFFPDRVFDRPEQVEFIALHLSDNPPKPPEAP